MGFIIDNTTPHGTEVKPNYIETNQMNGGPYWNGTERRREEDIMNWAVSDPRHKSEDITPYATDNPQI